MINESLKLLFVMLLWGGTFISGRILAQSMSSFDISFLRFLIASIILLFFSVKEFKYFASLNLKDYLIIFLLGLLGIFSYNYFFFSGLKTTQASKASIIIASNPTFTVLLASLFLNEHLSLKKIFGMILAFLGVLTVITKFNYLSLLSIGLKQGEIYLFCAAFSWVLYSILGKIILKKVSPLFATTMATIIGTILLFPFSSININSLSQTSLNSWLHLFYLGALGTSVGFILFYQGIQRIGASKAAAFINFVPIFGVTFGVLFLDEVIHMSLFIGLLFVIFGVYLINKH